MAGEKKTIELIFDLDTKQVKGEAIGYDGSACSLDLGPIMEAVGKKTQHVPKTGREQHVTRRQRT